jgi:uncharacterized protein
MQRSMQRFKLHAKNALYSAADVRVVLDTNTIISGLISQSGFPRKLLDGARTQQFDLCSSPVLMAELLDVLSREKFSSRLSLAGITPLDIVRDLRRLAYICTPANVPRVIENDPDDDHVLACAVAAQANLIVSGDKHLLGIGGQYQGIRIVTVAEAMQMISAR